MWTDRKIKLLKTRSTSYKQSEGKVQRGEGRLVIDVKPSGTKTAFYQYFYNSKREYIKIGKYKNSALDSGMTLAEINQEYERLASIFIKHSDVKGYLNQIELQKKQEEETSISVNKTLQEVLDRYLADKPLKEGTISDYKYAINQMFSEYLERPIIDINREVILTLYNKWVKKSPARAFNSIRVFRALYNYHRAIIRLDDGTHRMPENPVLVLSDTKLLKKVRRRDTYIANDQLKTWFESVRSLEETDYVSGEVVRDFLYFVILTGVRLNEAKTLRAKDINLSRGLFTLHDTKNGETIELPMSDYVADIVRRRLEDKGKYVFIGRKKKAYLTSLKRPLDYVRKSTGFHFTVHDLRRTFITVGESLDISIYTIKRLVNHTIQDSNDVTAGYVVRDLDRMRMATQRITDRILKLADVNKYPDNVEPIAKIA